jgi:hypothetical protein
MKLFLLCLLLMQLTCATTQVKFHAAHAAPKLAVVVVVDQLRTDEITQYASLWKGGFKRLLEEGRFYDHAMHSHGLTETASGHATIATGLPPRLNGITNKVMYFASNHRARGVCEEKDCEPFALAVPTLGDRLKKVSPRSLYIALAQKARSASLMGGQNADLVAWFHPEKPQLVGRPKISRAIECAYESVADDAHIAQTWTLPKLPKPFSERTDYEPYEMDCGSGVVFPHQLPKDKIAARKAWFCSPDSDRALQEFTLSVSQEYKLGQHDVPDLLFVSFSASDIVGHAFGMDSLERVAVLQAVDSTLGKLLEGLHAQVGENIFLIMTSDHGVAPNVLAARAKGIDSGRISKEELTKIVDDAICQELKRDDATFVEGFVPPFITLKPLPTQEKQRALVAALKALNAHPKMYKSWATDELVQDPDPIAQAMFESVYPGRAGDIAVVLKPYYNITAPDYGLNGAGHGTPWDYDRNVPVFVWGQGIRRERITTPIFVTEVMQELARKLNL